MKAYTGLKPFAFMSYSHKDEERIRPLIMKLQSIGCNIWYDEGILPADEWAEAIAHKVSTASLFFLIVSKNSIASQNVKREIYFAVSRDLPILSFYLEDVDMPIGLSMQLGISQAIRSRSFEEDCRSIFSIFPKETVNEGWVEPVVLGVYNNYTYYFTQSVKDTRYRIVRIDRETGEHKNLFERAEGNDWFIISYSCDSIHLSQADEFHDNKVCTLFFSVNVDMIHDRIEHLDRYLRLNFALTDPYKDCAQEKIVSYDTKRKEEDFSAETQLNCKDVQNRFPNMLK